MSQPSPTSSSVPTVVKATLTAMPDGAPLTVHFNPASLVYTVENSTQQQGSDPKRRQFAGQFTGKLSMDLQFDTTDTGVDVRQITGQVAMFMQSSATANKGSDGGANAPAPAVLSFEWGAYQFQGFMESFKETIDFFSADGIPLRAMVSIGLARQDNVFDTGSANTPPPSRSLVPTSSSSSAASAATLGGDPNAMRALASANGLENPRFTGGAALEVGGGIQLNAAAGFAASASIGGGFGIGISGGLGVGLSAGAGVGISVGAGAGFSAGASVGAGFGLGVGASAGAGVVAGGSLGVSVSTGAGGQVTLAAGGGALFGSTASARVPATAGAFAGLETGRATLSTTAQLDPARMLPATVGSDVAAGASASFGLGGVATAPSGFSTNVGATFSFSDRLTFDGD